jgi:hypothetical protein
VIVVRIHRTSAVVLVLSAALAPAAVAGAGSAAAHTPSPYCGQVWGSLPERDRTGHGGDILDVRTGRHACFDRFVVDVAGEDPGYSVRYVRVVHTEGQGVPVPLRGAADLEVIVDARAEQGDEWFQQDRDMVDTRGYRTFRQVAHAGSFEAQTTFGLGVRARLPFRTFVLDRLGPGSRLVVDVAHRW